MTDLVIDWMGEWGEGGDENEPNLSRHTSDRHTEGEIDSTCDNEVEGRKIDTKKLILYDSFHLALC